MNQSASLNKKYIKIILWSVFGIFGAFIIVAVASLAIQKFVNKSQAPMFLGYSFLIVETGSMNGTINEGDLIVIKKSKEYKLTEIVTYQRQGEAKPTTHRLTEYGPVEGTFYAKGDANNGRDPFPVKEEEIIGKYLFRIPKFGAVVEWFFDGGGIVYVIAFLAIVVAGSYFLHISNSDEEEAVEGASIEQNEEGANIAPTDINVENSANAPLSGADNLGIEPPENDEE